jgi:dCMP deaminase
MASTRDWPKFFIDITIRLSEQSKCMKLRTGALIVRDNRIVVMGYNGTSPGAPECCDVWKEWFNAHYKCVCDASHGEAHVSSHDALCSTSHDALCSTPHDAAFLAWVETKEFSEMHREWSARAEIHAECNALLYAARIGISVKDCDMYTTYLPCDQCTKNIIPTGIRRIFYKKLNPKYSGNIDVFQRNGINVIQVLD